MIDGVVSPSDKGTPQRGSLSSFLSNIILDDLDKEPERRGHAFCRYADDCNIYVRSMSSGRRVLESLTKFVKKGLRLKVNKEKSAVAKPHQRKFLGYSFTWHKQPIVRVPKESIKRLKANLKSIFRRGKGRNLQRFITEDLNPVVRGWTNYFCLAKVQSFTEEIDGWIRRRLRLIM